MENLIEELTKVNPANLSEEGLKLFNKIMEIIDKNRELEDKCIELSTTIDALEADNKELDKENEKIRKANKTLFELTQHTAMQEFINEDYIQKSKVEEKKEEALKRFNELHAKHYRDCGIAESREKAKIELCEELLQEGDK